MQLMADVFNLFFERRVFFIELLFQHIYLSAIAIVITTIIGVTAVKSKILCKITGTIFHILTS